MKFINPVAVTPAKLASSSIAEDDYAVWSDVTTYALGARVINTTTHRVYESVQAGNLNHTPTTDTAHAWWLDIAPTNRWAMFDGAVGSVSQIAGTLTVVLDPGQAIDSLALLDVQAASATISLLDSPAGVSVFERTVDMSSDLSIIDWWMYFFEPFASQDTLVLTDLPAYPNGRLTVILTHATLAKCGTLALGVAVEVGDEQYGPRIGVTDYSKKDTDDYGVTTLVKRAYAKRAELSLLISDAMVDTVARRLSEIRATPVVWLTRSRYTSLVIYGWVRDWGIVIAYPTYSEASLTIEGLT